MFIDDIQEIRTFVASALRETLTGTLAAERKFATERQFYNQQNTGLKQDKADRDAKIEKLTDELDREQDYNLQLFVDEQVTQLCQRAYFQFNLMTKDNHIKTIMATQDDRIVESQPRERANSILDEPTILNSIKKGQTPLDNVSQEGVERNSALDGSVHIGLDNEKN